MKHLIKAVFLLSCVLIVNSSAPMTRPEDEALKKVLECALMSPERKNATKLLVYDLQRVMQERWPGSKVIQYGSLIVNTATKTSDVDCFVQLPQGLDPSNQTLAEAADQLAKYPHLFHNIEPVFTSFASVVHFTHTPTGHQGDFNFRSSEERMHSYIQKHILKLDVRAHELAVLIKYWAYLHKPLRAEKIMSNFTIVNLVIFYLQQIKVLPPIMTLQNENKEWDASKIESADNNNMVFNDIPYHSSNNDTFFEILSGFFKFYADFDFENKIVSTFSGTAMDRKIFEKLSTVPDIFDTYKIKVKENKAESLNITTPVCIQNVLIHGKNLASTTTKEALEHFRSNLRVAAETIVDLYPNSVQSIFNDMECFRNF